MSKRTNSFPTFTPSTKTKPPTSGFQPANLILSSQVNGAVYMSYNFVNSFVNALIDMGSLDDSAIYSYTDTNLATKITADFNGWFNNRINSYNFTKIEISEQADDYAELTITGLSISNPNRLSSLLTYEQLNFTNDQKSLTMMADHLSWNDGNGTSSYLSFANLNYMIGNTTINFLPSTIKSSTSSQTLKCVYAKEFTDHSSVSFFDQLTKFLNENSGKLTTLSIVLTSEYDNNKETQITAIKSGTDTYRYFHLSTTDGSTYKWLELTGFASLNPTKMTIQFC